MKIKCKNCRLEFTPVNKYNKKLSPNIFCSTKCSAIFRFKIKENHPRWRSGRGNHSSGYLTLRIGKNKYKLEHRLIMEKHLGRKLKSCEIVHHKNDNRKDNRIENLEVMTISDHISLHHRGIGSRTSRLSEEKVIEIRRSYLRKKELSKKFEISLSNVYRIKNRETWKHIP